MPIPTTKDLLAISPQLILTVFGMLVLLLDSFWPKMSKRLLANVSILGFLAAGGAVVALWPKGTVAPAMQGMVMADGFTAFFTLALLIGGAISVLLSVNYLERERVDHGEYYALLLFTILGGIVMVCSVNLICVFIGLEILSISLYILAGYRTENVESDEAAMKYFLLGAFASAFFLYGIALVFGATHSLELAGISASLKEAANAGGEPSKNFLLLSGIAMMLVGFGFKVAVVPFHIWTPDVYQGAPTPVTAFMSVAAKVAGFAAFLRVLTAGLQDQGVQLQVSAVLASIAALTMLVGNVVAVVQTNLKRLLAYSSIAHAGYILVGLVAAVRPGGGLGFGAEAQSKAVSAVMFYALAYTVSNLGAFAVILALRRKGEEATEVSDLAGLGARCPLLAALMSMFMLSLAGLPPFAGFFGKLFLLNALVRMNTPLPWLIVLFALTSVVSFYYYLGIVRAMYMDRAPADKADESVAVTGGHLKLALAVSAIGTVLLGLWAGGALGLAERVAKEFVGGGPFSAMR